MRALCRAGRAVTPAYKNPPASVLGRFFRGPRPGAAAAEGSGGAGRLVPATPGVASGQHVLRTADLEYHLPEGLIATHPVEPRDAARLMVLSRAEGRVADHAAVRDLPTYLRPGDVLVFNATRVLRARFEGVRADTGGRVEGLFLADGPRPGVWRVLLRGKRVRVGRDIVLFDRHNRPMLVLRVLERDAEEEGGWFIEARRATFGARSAGERGPDASPPPTGASDVAAGDPEPRPAATVLEEIGRTPLPPYILKARRDAADAGDDDRDRLEYQTVYAGDQAGSVAAPTAGLHFTPVLLDTLARRGVRLAQVVLHVGTGTFRPVESETVEAHPMHAEWCCVPEAAMDEITRARAEGRRVIAVGTTSARTLESAAASPGYRPGEWLSTRLLISPGYPWRWVDGMLTNFHLPRSTLMAMIAALLPGGVADLKAAYAQAVERRYRFYSFGDAMLILP